jgi:short subunit fatty acids transporter
MALIVSGLWEVFNSVHRKSVRWEQAMLRKKTANKANILGDAMLSWKAGHESGAELSPAARDRVLNSVVSGTGAGNLPANASLFPVYHRFALAAIIPAGLLALVLAITLGNDPAPPTITVEKVGNQVVFNISNGGTAHSISKSNTPHTFDSGRSVRVQDGSYRDSMVEDGDLVFYRID